MVSVPGEVPSNRADVTRKVCIELLPFTVMPSGGFHSLLFEVNSLVRSKCSNKALRRSRSVQEAVLDFAF